MISQRWSWLSGVIILTATREITRPRVTSSAANTLPYEPFPMNAQPVSIIDNHSQQRSGLSCKNTVRRPRRTSLSPN